jgi:4-alpha-glucanotransferase
MGTSAQRQVEQYFAGADDTEETRTIKQGLFDLISNVILFEEEASEGDKFHFRFGMDGTISLQHLEWNTQQKLKDLYIDYFFRRQDDFWKKEAMHKLPYLKRATNMLICGEDLGMVPRCVPEVMKQLGILSLEIQRMPKVTTKEFFHPNDAPYLSVVTPSTHDMSTIRGWWEEDRSRTQRFFNNILGQQGGAPYFCEAWVNRAIVLQHLYCPAMWSIFQLQDLLGMNEKIRRENPHEERINIPANPQHYWRYRIHLTLEDLLKQKDFNEELKGYVVHSGR